ncbi:MAG: hypothetical protein EOO89_00310 [Pedobacter sp.]|nr:MAG: hypothetical protein EOO89_00310 [Pedobacter sp.]
MAKNYFSTVRKSFLINILFSGILSNLVVFGQPVEQILFKYINNRKIEYFSNYNNDSKPIDNLVASPSLQHFKEVHVKAKTEPAVYIANEPEGIIGAREFESENPVDNFFGINLPVTADLDKYEAVLTYDLFGLTDAPQTTKSINNHKSYGGKAFVVSDKWTTVTEVLPANQLIAGYNEIYFNRRDNANYQYKLKNVRIELREKNSNTVKILEHTLKNYNGNLYLIGTSTQKNGIIKANGLTIPVIDGIFEQVISNFPKNSKELEISYVDAGKEVILTSPVVYHNAAIDKQFANSDHSNIINNYAGENLKLGSVAYNNFLSISIPTLFTGNRESVSVEGLQFKDLRSLNVEMENVTAGDYTGYRVTRNNLPDSVTVKMHLKFDPAKIPDGYAAKDVKTFYFNRSQRSWIELEIDSLDLTKNEIISNVLVNDTDYINGVIKVPDSPESGNFVPTAITDMKYADPSSGVVSIPPPSPNSTGVATTRFPIKLPQGRNGLQPSLDISYNSEGGNGWMGVGWDMPMQAISLNTKWGVPTFNQIKESELYSMSGADLVLKVGGEYTNPHRTANITRTGERIFYQRKESGYQKIIRHGSSTQTYWWEVIDKLGNKVFYGGYNNELDNAAVIKSADGQGHIGYWAIKRVEDPDGNYIEYNYGNGNSTVGNTSIVAKKFYLENIKYTLRSGSAGNYYQVDFKRDNYTLPASQSISREDATVNARNGYLQIVDYLLTEIHVSLYEQGVAKRIRTYSFGYNSPTFKKQQLSSISEYDAANLLFYTNTLEYYNDTNPQSIISTSTTDFNSEHIDEITTPLGGLSGVTQNLMPKGSLLGTSESSGYSFGLRVGVGLDLNVQSVGLTLGGALNYNVDNMATRISFMDMNGDGLPDKVIKKDNGGVAYRPNNGAGFGTLINVTGISNLTKVKSRTIGGLVDANAMGLFGIGKGWSKTKTETDNYFSDFNGDGFPDIVAGNRVRFNIAAGVGSGINDREFDSNPSLSANPIIAGAINQEVLEGLSFETMDELRAEHPQYDHVKVWKAPYRGAIMISGFAAIRSKNPGNEPNNFRVSIEQADFNQTSGPAIQLEAATLSTVDTAVNMDQLYVVEKGDLIFFRVHNLGYGYGGEVEWNPLITYVAIEDAPYINQTDENGKRMDIYNAKNDFIINNGGFSTRNTQTLFCSFNLENGYYPANKFSDDIRFIAQRISINDSGVETVTHTWTRTYNHKLNSFGGNGGFTMISNGSGNTIIYRFFTESDSSIDWSEIKWKPVITAGTVTVSYPEVSHRIYEFNANDTKYWVDGSQLVTPTSGGDATDFMRITHDFFENFNPTFLDDLPAESFPISINWVVKTKTGNVTEVLHKRSFFIYRQGTSSSFTYLLTKTGPGDAINVLTDTDYYSYNIRKGVIRGLQLASGRIYSAFYVDNMELAKNTNKSISLALLPAHQSTYPAFSTIILEKPFFSTLKEFYGIPYRGWGQFLYHGGIKFDLNDEGEITNPNNPQNFGEGRIDMSLFDYGSQSTAAQDIDMENTDPDDIEFDGGEIRYTFYNQNNFTGKYFNQAIINSNYGYNADGELTSSIGRFGESNLYDMYIDPNNIELSDNNGLFVALKQRGESKGDSEAANGLGGSVTTSFSKSKVLNQYIDLNGDRYPDMVTKGRIQFTDMLGGMSQKIINNQHITEDDSTDRTVGISVSSQLPNSTQSSNGKVTGNKTVTNANAGMNGSEGESYNSKQWVDINGDGLTDKVFITSSVVKVNLNTGYGFAPEMIWTVGTPAYGDVSNRTNVSANIGVSVATSGASYAVGFGGLQSTSNLNTMLLDVNGDQLPDLVIDTAPGYSYYLNTGTGFDNQLRVFSGQSAIEQDMSIAGNIFGAGTFGFGFTLAFISFKVVFTLSIGGSANFSQKKATVQDINGDGLCDVLQSGNSSNGTVTARLNTVGRTHLLKKVNTPLGGNWIVDYSRNPNTMNMPHSKWVVSKIETYDGFTGDNSLKPDKTLRTVTYENPMYDRREREFLGFEHVKTEEKNPVGNATYRSIVKSYHNTNYYLSGAEKATATYGESGQPLTEQTTLYNILDPDEPVVNQGATVQNKFMQVSLIQDADALLDKSRLFVTVAKVVATSYENGQGLSAVKEFKKYDEYGNLEEYIDYGTDAEDAYKAVIKYHSPGLENGVAFPESISVFKNSTNELMRQRTATYNSIGKLIRVEKKLNGTEKKRTSFEYNIFGNVTKIHDLDNLNDVGDHYTKTIDYETVLNTYPSEISNSFNEKSFNTYNYLFGIPVLVKDVNGKFMRTRIDTRGRIVEVTAPNEMAAENGGAGGWTIRTIYKGEDAVSNSISSQNYNLIAAKGIFRAALPGAANITDAQHYALTRHFDPEFANPTGTSTTNHLLTVSIVDGFGQALQTKKTHKVEDDMKWLLSGYEKKDAFGRTTHSYLPTSIAFLTGSPLTHITTASQHLRYTAPATLSNPIEFKFDERDRAIKITQPAESLFSTVEYSIENGSFVQKTVNEKSQAFSTYTDIRGRKRKTVQNDEIATKFKYNSINELVEVEDNDGFFTKYIYDLGGRQKEVQHPDRGVVLFKYDNADRLIKQSNSNLFLNGNLEIEYDYDFNRIVKVTYPTNVQNNVKYTYGKMGDTFAENENAIGRLLYQEDATGVQVFGYGNMGEVTKNLRSVAVAGYQSYWFFTRWKYDSWNRVQEIIYPDQDVITYGYNTAGMPAKITSVMDAAPSYEVVKNITYNSQGDRSSITFGNNAKTTYQYDARSRMNKVTHLFNNYTISKDYKFDVLSNITEISTVQPAAALPPPGQIGGPVYHEYTYDTYNRIATAKGNYTGPDDIAPTYLKQRYNLVMDYNSDHTINTKIQTQNQGKTTAYGGNVTDEVPVYKNSYKLEFSGYATASYIAGSNYGYKQPHAPRKIVEYPSWVENIAADDPRIRHKEISYDFNGNLTEIKEKVGEVRTSLRKNVWDEENRLAAVDLKPDQAGGHALAIYTYNAAGERTVRYNYDRIDVFTNGARQAGKVRDNVMLYPSGLLMGKAIHVSGRTREDRINYTKHYYIGSERVSAKIGTLKQLGYFPIQLLGQQMPGLNTSTIRGLSTALVTKANNLITATHTTLNVPLPEVSSITEPNLQITGHNLPAETYYFHPDHLGSSSYITNSTGRVSQHMEYLPFGETMTDEHLASRNSPFKYNGKEFDEETGNYYYGARYYDPKWSIFISVDPLAEKTFDSYAYCYNNPVRFVDPTGMQGEDTYKIDKNGYITLVDRKVHYDENGKEVDKLVTGSANYNSEGKLMNNNVNVEKGVLGKKLTLSGELARNGKTEDVEGLALRFGDKENAKEVFKFVSQNVDVEYAMVTAIDKKGNTTGTALFTSHKEDIEIFSAPYALKLALNGELGTHTHNHPDHINFDPSPSDTNLMRKSVQGIEKYNSKNGIEQKNIGTSKFFIYHRGTTYDYFGKIK